VDAPIEKSWQETLVWDALGAGKIDEPQFVLLLALYRHADYSTRTISDFRAEMACRWLGYSDSYASTMRKRLQTLRDDGWYEWTWVRGKKVPYDVILRPAYCGEFEGRGASPALGDTPVVRVTEEGGGGSPVSAFESPVEVLNLPTKDLMREIKHAPCAGGAPLLTEAAEILKAKIYAAADGALLDNLLTPSQIDRLLSQHEICAIMYAIEERQSKVTVRREFQRSFGSFLRGGGVAIELAAAQEELRHTLNNIRDVYQYEDKLSMDTQRARILDRLRVFRENNDTALQVFPDIAREVSELVDKHTVTQETAKI
jgi:hypothetical protein